MGSGRRLTALAAGALTVALAACSGGSAGPAGPAAATSPAAGPSGTASPARRLAGPPPPGGSSVLNPAQLRAAYDVGQLLRRGIDGRGQTIVIVDPFGSPGIQHDLAFFDQ